MHKELYTINKEAKRLRDKLNMAWDISEHIDPGEQPSQIECIQDWGLSEEMEQVLEGTPFLNRCMFDGTLYPTWAYERYLNYAITKQSNRHIEYDENGEDSDGFTEEDNQIEIKKMENEIKKINDKIDSQYEYKFDIKCQINDLYKIKENVLDILLEKNEAEIIGYHTFITENKNASNKTYRELRHSEAVDDMNDDDDDANHENYDGEDLEVHTHRKVVEYNGFRFHYKLVEDHEEIADLGRINGEISSKNELIDGPTVEDSIEKLKKFIEKEK